LCHGGDGKLGAAGAKNLTVLTSSVEDIKAVIMNGKNSMPAADVTPEQAAAIADYVVANIQGK
jgi:mono/diheme cytochrome c family protein